MDGLGLRMFDAVRFENRLEQHIIGRNSFSYQNRPRHLTSPDHFVDAAYGADLRSRAGRAPVGFTRSHKCGRWWLAQRHQGSSADRSNVGKQLLGKCRPTLSVWFLTRHALSIVAPWGRNRNLDFPTNNQRTRRETWGDSGVNGEYAI